MAYEVELLPPAVGFLQGIDTKLRAKAARTIELLRPDIDHDRPAIINSPDFVPELVRPLDPGRLAGLSIVDLMNPIPDLFYGERIQHNMRRTALIYGADAMAEYVLLFEFEECLLAAGATAFRYGDDWKINSPYGATSGLGPRQACAYVVAKSLPSGVRVGKLRRSYRRPGDTLGLTRCLKNMRSPVRVTVISASVITAAFGLWHFFIPAAWDWYAFMSPDAPELAIAVRAINIFFSLSLVLFAVMNIALVVHRDAGWYSLAVVLGASTILWAVRVVLQIVAPQGSEIPFLRWAMLGGFVVTFGLYLGGLVAVLLGAAYRLRSSRAARTPER